MPDSPALEPAQQAAIDAADASVCVLDRTGQIIAVNRAWIDFGRTNGRAHPEEDVGRPYPARGHDGIHGVLDGSSRHYSTVYPCHSPGERRWFRMLLVPVGHQARRVLVIHRRLAEAPTAVEMEPAGEELGRRWGGTRTVCGWCDAQVRDALGRWVAARPEPGQRLSHGLCPGCATSLLPDARPIHHRTARQSSGEAHNRASA